MPKYFGPVEGLLVLILALATVYYYSRHNSQQHRAPSAIANSKAASRDPFPEGVEIFDSLDQASQSRLIHVVSYFCSQQYHAESCVHYLVKCGHPCLAFLNRENQIRAVASYKSLSQKNVQERQ